MKLLDVKIKQITASISSSVGMKINKKKPVVVTAGFFFTYPLDIISKVAYFYFLADFR
jgi:hypothetical protein